MSLYEKGEKKQRFFFSHSLDQLGHILIFFPYTLRMKKALSFLALAAFAVTVVPHAEAAGRIQNAQDKLGVLTKGVSTSHVIDFKVLNAVTATDIIRVTFPADFNVTTLDPTDVTATGLTVNMSGANVIELSGATLAAGAAQKIEIASGAIVNPTTAGLQQIKVETTKADGTLIDNAYMGVYILADDQVQVRATVDPTLEFSILGSGALNFGSLEPNAFHKLGGAAQATLTITGSSVAGSGFNAGETITIGSGTSYAKTFTFTGAYAKHLTTTDVVLAPTASETYKNLARAINNTMTVVRADAPADIAGVITAVTVRAVTPGTSGNDVLSTNSGSVMGSGGIAMGFGTGMTGYNLKGTDVTPATGSVVNNGSVGNSIFVATNAANGYTATMSGTAMTHTDGVTTIPAWNGAQYGFGCRVAASATPADCTTANIVSTSTLPTAGKVIPVEYVVRVDATQKAGEYTTTIVYNVTANY